MTATDCKETDGGDNRRRPRKRKRSVLIAIIVATGATRAAASDFYRIEFAVSSARVMLARAYVAFDFFVTFEHKNSPSRNYYCRSGEFNTLIILSVQRRKYPSS